MNDGAGSRDCGRVTMRFGLRVSVGVALLVALAAAVPVRARERSCGAPDSGRSLSADTNADTMSTVTVSNRRPTPLTVEWVEGAGAVPQSVTLAPGASTQLWTYLTAAWVSRDARRRCLSRFVPEQKLETWEIVAVLEGDYRRKDILSFPVYIAPEFDKHDRSVVEQCLQFLEASAKRMQDVIPSTAWKKISGTPIWLEYEADKPHVGAYFGAPEVLAANGVAVAKARSIQFYSSLAVMAGSARNPLLHEIAHAYHDRVLSYAYDPVLAAYRSAQLNGRYDGVRRPSGRVEQAYAMTDHREFFAELSEAYFGTVDYFPFTREDLREFDPSSYRVIANAWERPLEKAPAAWTDWLRRIPK